MNRRRIILVAAALLVLLASRPPNLKAQERLPAQPEWGTSVQAARTAHALGFVPSESSTTYSYDLSTTHRYRTGGTAYFDFTLSDLPAGALLNALELQACDSNASTGVTAYLFRMNDSNLPAILGSVATGDAAMPGCGFFQTPLSHPVDNFLNAYFLRVFLGASNSTTSFGAVRVFYKLQVSPSPAVATFPADVPTSHPFFRFIEALAAAGITGGCGPGAYCPDQPITRGQMAVFLSVALGLHFAN